jgi:hypothetical protein
MKTACSISAAFILGLAATSASAVSLGENLLGNAGFEEPIVYEPPADGNWLGFFGPTDGPFPKLFSGSTNEFARSGDRSLLLRILDLSGSFVGAVQQVSGLTPGLTATYSGYVAGFSQGGSIDPGVEFRIEWIDSATGQEISRTPSAAPTPGEAWEMFTVSGVVPEGADTANVVAVIQSFTGPAAVNVTYVDDTSFTVVPLPGALVLMLGALVPLGAFKRKRQG